VLLIWYNFYVELVQKEQAAIFFGGILLVDGSDGGIVLTRSGFDELTQELQHILTVKRPAVVDRIREARQLGDLSENFDYEDAKRSQAMLESRLREVKAILANAKVVEDGEHNGSVSVGCKVVVRDLDDDVEDEYTIVGPAESNPAEGRISMESCVGGALIGRKVGEIVRVSSPGGLMQLEVLAIK
jgi:transcription elongation factor GreA